MKVPKRLFKLFSRGRPYGSPEDQGYRAWLTATYRNWGLNPVHDKMGNISVFIQPDKTRTIFSCHTDTVHMKGDRLDLEYHADIGVLASNGKVQLGADDTAGIYLMERMMLAKIPGLYIFHSGEERGCVGSKWNTGPDGQMKAFGKDRFDRCIAFDRKGYDSIITCQRGDRCASDLFAASLSTEIGPIRKKALAADPGGVYTDSAEYVDYVPECTNISVGYEGHHTFNETQDVEFLMELEERLRTVKWEQLPVAPHADRRGSRWGNWGGSRYTGDNWAGGGLYRGEYADMFGYADGNRRKPYGRGYEGVDDYGNRYTVVNGRRVFSGNRSIGFVQTQGKGKRGNPRGKPAPVNQNAPVKSSREVMLDSDDIQSIIDHYPDLISNLLNAAELSDKDLERAMFITWGYTPPEPLALLSHPLLGKLLDEDITGGDPGNADDTTAFVPGEYYDDC